MKINVKSYKSLKDLDLEMWNNVFEEAVYGVNNVNEIRVVDFKNGEPYFQEGKFKNVLEGFVDLIKVAGDYNEVELTIDSKVTIKDKDKNWLNVEIEIVESDELVEGYEIKTKYYYEAGNFLGGDKKYSTIDSVE